MKDRVVKRKRNKSTETKKKNKTSQLQIVRHYLYQNTSSNSCLVVVVFFVCVVVNHSQNSEFLRVCVNVSLFPLFDLHCYLQGSEICIFLTLMFPRCVQVYGLTLQRGVTGTARMLHALTHSSILDKLGSKCNQAASRLFVKELALL